jgi:hypothetical protein
MGRDTEEKKLPDRRSQDPGIPAMHDVQDVLIILDDRDVVMLPATTVADVKHIERDETPEPRKPLEVGREIFDDRKRVRVALRVLPRIRRRDPKAFFEKVVHQSDAIECPRTSRSELPGFPEDLVSDRRNVPELLNHTIGIPMNPLNW